MKSYGIKPGKFEMNRSPLMAELVYSASMHGVEEQAGDVSIVGYACRIDGKKHSFIVEEDCAGFVYVQAFPLGDKAYFDTWEKLVQSLEEGE